MVRPSEALVTMREACLSLLHAVKFLNLLADPYMAPLDGPRWATCGSVSCQGQLGCGCPSAGLTMRRDGKDSDQHQLHGRAATAQKNISEDKGQQHAATLPCASVTFSLLSHRVAPVSGGNDCAEPDCPACHAWPRGTCFWAYIRPMCSCKG
jgi:hypothetical protein